MEHPESIGWGVGSDSENKRRRTPTDVGPWGHVGGRGGGPAGDSRGPEEAAEDPAGARGDEAEAGDRGRGLSEGRKVAGALQLRRPAGSARHPRREGTRPPEEVTSKKNII